MRYNIYSGFVAQLVRALPCHGRGREFESRRIRHKELKQDPWGLILILYNGYGESRT